MVYLKCVVVCQQPVWGLGLLPSLASLFLGERGDEDLSILAQPVVSAIELDAQHICNANQLLLMCLGKV